MLCLSSNRIILPELVVMSSATRILLTNLDGTIALKSADNEFDIWDNIKLNLDTILQIWTFRREGETVKRTLTKFKMIL